MRLKLSADMIGNCDSEPQLYKDRTCLLKSSSGRPANREFRDNKACLICTERMTSRRSGLAQISVQERDLDGVVNRSAECNSLICPCPA